jgi:hypothetical protein
MRLVHLSIKFHLYIVHFLCVNLNVLVSFFHSFRISCKIVKSSPTHSSLHTEINKIYRKSSCFGMGQFHTLHAVSLYIFYPCSYLSRNRFLQFNLNLFGSSTNPKCFAWFQYNFALNLEISQKRGKFFFFFFWNINFPVLRSNELNTGKWNWNLLHWGFFKLSLYSELAL